MEKFYVLFNPLSNSNKGQEAANALKATAYDKELHYVDITKLSSYQDFFATINEDDTVIICGGDGTLNRFVNAMAGLDIKNVVCYLPTGTGNDFFKDVKGSSSTPIVINEFIKNLPVCEINGKNQLFVNGVGYGIDGYCCEVGDELRKKSDKHINYAGIAIKGLLFHYKPTNATIIVDGQEYFFKKVWLAPIMKGRYYGGGMMPTPNQDRSNGKLSVMLFHGSNKLKTLMIFPSLFKGEHIKHSKYVTVLEGDEITVKYDSPRAAQIDGETVLGVSSCRCYTPSE